MKDFQYSVITSKTFDEAVKAVEENTAAKGFRVLHTHDVAATLAEKGFEREPLKIVEVCNAKYAQEVLQMDITTALMLPCPIMVYQKEGKTYISTMLPSLMGQFFPGKGIEPVAALVQTAVVSIVDESAK
ncbi:MAG: DUF302 domain-containing protein [Acidobacteriota bacterium]|nr:DUF302 domain-containing protein [Acidobacteriota bacterium]